jgi:hypothetical protein
MVFEPATVVAITSAVIGGGLALVWGIYTHISTRKVSKLTYETSQLSDFGVPISFLADVPRAPLAITVTSRGNKATQNIIIRLKTTSAIENFEASPADLPIRQTGNELVIQTEALNPSQKIKLFARCVGSPSEDQIEELEITHSEGGATNESEVRSISFSFAGIELEYNTSDLKTHLVRVGPFSFR